MIQSLTYGELPEFERFRAAFNSRYPLGVYKIRDCRILDAIYEGGNVDFSLEETWNALKQCAAAHKNNHELEEIGINILNSLGFKWV